MPERRGFRTVSPPRTTGRRDKLCTIGCGQPIPVAMRADHAILNLLPAMLGPKRPEEGAIMASENTTNYLDFSVTAQDGSTVPLRT